MKKYNSHDNYVSAVHVYITEKYPELLVPWSRYYKGLRSNIFNEFKDLEQSSGIPMAENAKCMKVGDRDFICKQLFKEENYELRAAIALDWMGVGRISEVYFLITKIIIVTKLFYHCSASHFPGKTFFCTTKMI